MGPGAAAQDMVLRELEPSEPYIGRRGCPIDHKVTQSRRRRASR